MVFGSKHGVHGRQRAETHEHFPPGDRKYAEEICNEIIELEDKRKFFSTYVLPEDDRPVDQMQLAERILDTMNNMISTVINTDIEELENKDIALMIVHAFYRSQQLHKLWETVEYPFFGGLLAAFVLNEMHKGLDKMHELQQCAKYKEAYDKVVNRVLKLLNDCYIDNEDNAINAIKIDYHPYIASHAHQEQYCSQLTLLDLAFKADCDSFLGHNCSKKVISERWKKGFRAKGLRFFFSIFFIPMFYLVEFNKQRKERVISHFIPLNRRRISGYHPNMYTISRKPNSWDRTVNWIKKVIMQTKLFYSSICFKFYLHTLSHFLYILLFASVLLTDTDVLSNEKLFSYGWWRAFIRIAFLGIYQLSYVFEILFHFVYNDIFIWKEHIANFVHSSANVIGFFLYVSSYLCTLFEASVLCTIFRSIAFFFFYVSFIFTTLRTMRILSTNAFYGIIILMIRKMTETLTSFGVIFGIFWFAFAVTMISLTGNSDNSLGWRIFMHGAFEIFGEVQDVHRNGQLDECDTVFYLSNATDRTISCAFRSTMIPIIVFSYMFIVTILIVNLVIAFFTNTYDTIRSTSQLHYRYKKYERLVQYETTTWWPHPFSLIYYIVRLIEKAFSQCTSCQCCHWHKDMVVGTEPLLPSKDRSHSQEYSFDYEEQPAKHDDHGNMDFIDSEEAAQPHEVPLDPVPIGQGVQPQRAADFSAATAPILPLVNIPPELPPTVRSAPNLLELVPKIIAPPDHTKTAARVRKTSAGERKTHARKRSTSSISKASGETRKETPVKRKIVKTGRKAQEQKGASTSASERKPERRRDQPEAAGRQAGIRPTTAGKTQTEIEMERWTRGGAPPAEVNSDEDIQEDTLTYEEKVKKRTQEIQEELIDYVKGRRDRIVTDEQRTAKRGSLPVAIKRKKGKKGLKKAHKRIAVELREALENMPTRERKPSHRDKAVQSLPSPTESGSSEQ